MAAKADLKADLDRGHRAKRASKPAPRRAQVTVRHVSPWSVLKFSLLFYFCVMLVFLFALVILYWVLAAMGVTESIAKTLSELRSQQAGPFEIHGGWLFSRTFMVGLAGVVVWSLVNMFVSVLYNLVADIVGGIQVTLTEKR